LKANGDRVERRAGEPLDQDAPLIPREGEREGRLGASILDHCAD